MVTRPQAAIDSRQAYRVDKLPEISALIDPEQFKIVTEGEPARGHPRGRRLRQDDGRSAPPR